MAMEQSVKPNSLEKFKVIALAVHTLPNVLDFFLKKKKDFSKNRDPVNLGLRIWF